MHQLLFKILRYSGLPFLFREVVQRPRVTIVMMHDISLPAARQAFSYWKRHYNIITMQDYLNACKDKSVHQLPPKSLVLTFDDGHKGNFELLPLIEELEIPITIFLCSDIVGTNRHFWFLHEGCNADNLKKVPNNERKKQLAETGLSETEEYSVRQALSSNEIAKMKKSTLINFQSHTRFHPILTQCADKKAFDEINTSKETLEKRYNLSVEGFAYPNGNYSTKEIAMVKEAGYRYALTTNPGFNSLQTDLFELKRFSVNDSTNLNEIVVKTSGVWGIMKSIVRMKSSINDR